jgi:hypothetical protein
MGNIMATQAYNIDTEWANGNKREIAEFDSSQEECTKEQTICKEKKSNKREIAEFDSSQEECSKGQTLFKEKSSSKREIAEFDSSQELDSGCEPKQKVCKVENNEAKKLKTQDKNETNKEKKDEKDEIEEEKIENKPSPKKDDGQDDLMDIMLCAICSEIMHNCVWYKPNFIFNLIFLDKKLNIP